MQGDAPMKLSSVYIRLALGILLAFLALPAIAFQMPQPFSADFTTTMHNGEKMTGKWFFAPPKMRVDMTSMPGRNQGPMAGNISMIVDGATETNYMLMHGPQMYMEFHGERQNSMSPDLRNMLQLKGGSDPCSGDPDRTCKKVGTETVNGRSCDKWEVTDKKSGKSTMCVDQKIHFPVRIQEADGTTMDMNNIKEGPQDPSLFKVPAGYRPFDPSAFGGQRRPH
jgi:outer membrane lipoprotein-sorting protein